MQQIRCTMLWFDYEEAFAFWVPAPNVWIHHPTVGVAQPVSFIPTSTSTRGTWGRNSLPFPRLPVGVRGNSRSCSFSFRNSRARRSGVRGVYHSETPGDEAPPRLRAMLSQRVFLDDLHARLDLRRPSVTRGDPVLVRRAQASAARGLACGELARLARLQQSRPRAARHG